jgi:cell division protein FtsB
MENTIETNNDYTQYKNDSDFIEWIKEQYKESYRRKNPIREDVNTLQSLKELVNEREKKASSYADEIFFENSDYVNWQEWKHFLEKVNV